MSREKGERFFSPLPTFLFIISALSLLVFSLSLILSPAYYTTTTPLNNKREDLSPAYTSVKILESEKLAEREKETVPKRVELMSR